MGEATTGERGRVDAPRVVSWPERSGTLRVPALDGVRAVAVIAVLGFHGGLSWARGGFLGVDAFFVLSGYLIVSLLLAESERTGRIAIVAFWSRRIRRLLPALLLLVAVVTLTARWFVPPEEAPLLRGDGLSALFYVANWRMVLRGGDYFANTAGPSPLEHTWSLGIEEQFYVVCPLLLVGVIALARRPRAVLLLIGVGGVVASTVAMWMVYDPADPGRSYYGTDTRVSSLLVGVTLAVLLAGLPDSRLRERPVRILSATLAGAGVVFLCWAWTHALGTDQWLYHGGMLVSALCVAAVLAHVVVAPEGITSRLLALPPLPALGLISYGVYLWHWPVFLAVDGERTGLVGWPLFSLRCAITVGIASASYLLLERPVRRSSLLQSAQPDSLAAAAAVAGVSLLLVTVPTTSMSAPSADRADGTAPVGGLERLIANGPHTGSPQPPADTRYSGAPAPPHRWRPGTQLVVDVFGDSLPWSLVRALPTRQGIDVRDRTILGCGITLSAPYQYFGNTYPQVYRVCRHWQRHWSQALAADHPHLALIMVGRWETMTRKFRGRWRAMGDPVYDAYLRRRLDAAISVAGGTGARVLLATLPYNRHGERSDGGLFPEDQPERVTAWNKLLRDVAAHHPGTAVLDIGHRISPKGRYTETAGGFTMRTDGLHLAPDGVRNWIAPWLYPRLVRLAPR